MYGYIYKTMNLANNRLYIGQKKGGFDPNYFGSGIYIKRALNKYGKDKFKLEVIIYTEDKQKLDELEKKYIAEYREKFGKNKMYNITDGGEGCEGYKHTEEFKKKQSLINMGENNSMYGVHRFGKDSPRYGKKHPHSQETKEKMSLSMLGKNTYVRSEETKRKISLAKRGNKCRLGKKHSEETKAKIQLALEKYWRSKNA